MFCYFCFILRWPIQKVSLIWIFPHEVENGLDRQDAIVNGGTLNKTEPSDPVCTWSTSSSHPALIPNQSGTCGPKLKADKQNSAPVVALCPASRFSLSSVFTRHLSITCNLLPFHARLQNQLVCVTLGPRLCPQLSKLSRSCKNNNNKSKSPQVRRGNGVWWLSSWVVYLRVVFPVQPLIPDWICTWGCPIEDEAKSAEFARV